MDSIKQHLFVIDLCLLQILISAASNTTCRILALFLPDLTHTHICWCKLMYRVCFSDAE